MLIRTLKRCLRIGAGRDIRLIAWLMIALAAMFCAYIARMRSVMHDMFHEMALFREALLLGRMPLQDIFAFTPTVDMSVHHEWGTGAILYFATVGSGLGIAGLAILKFVLVVAIWGVLYRVARLRGASPIVFAFAAFAVFPVMWVGFSTIRAQLFTLLFLAIQLWMQECDARGNRTWVVGWLVMLTLWLNIHAGFVVGLALAVTHTAERFVIEYCRTRSIAGTLASCWHLAVAAIGSLAVLPINPYGWHYISYLIRAIRMPRPMIGEWQPIWHTYAPGLTLFLLAIASTMALYAVLQLSRRGKHTSPSFHLRGAVMLLLALGMTIKHLRHGSLFGVLWIAYVPAWITHLGLGRAIKQFASHRPGHTIRICQIVTAGCLCFAVLNQAWKPIVPAEPRYSTVCYPVGAVDYLQRQRFQGNLFTPFHAGSYVSWTMYPDVRVSLDGRYEVAYQSHVMEEHEAFLRGEPGWSSFLDRYPVDAILVHKAAPVFRQLHTLWQTESSGPGFAQHEAPDNLYNWRAVYEDEAYLVVAAAHTGLEPEHRGASKPQVAPQVFTAAYAHWKRQASSDRLTPQ